MHELLGLSKARTHWHLQVSHGDGRYLDTEGEAAKVDPIECLMETLVLQENQEGISIRRRRNNPGNYAKHLPEVLKRFFLQTICGWCDDGQAQPETVTRSGDQCGSSDVRKSGDRSGSGDVRRSGDRCAGSNVRGSGNRCVSGDVGGSGD
jgi:hypothetical protein